jgi:SulP family sulfate permease
MNPHGAAELSPEPSAPQRFGWLFRRVPALDALRTYSGAKLFRDVAAGLTVATVAVPQAMAYASLAGLPPQYGLYTAIVMTAVGALFDSSRQLINGPTNAISIALLSALAVVPEPDRIAAAVLLAFLVGVIQIGIALLGLGDLTHFVSPSVIVGFTLGAATLLMLDQSKNFLGLEPRGQPTDHFIVRFWLSLTGSRVHLPTVLVAAGTIAIVLALRRLNRLLRPKGMRFPIPQHLVAVVAMGLLVWGLGLETRGVKVAGPVPAALPSFQLPELRWDLCRQEAENALAIAFLGLLEALAMAKAIAAGTGQKLDLNQQCFSEGAANLAGSFFQCFPGSGSLTRSAVNQQASAASQWSGVFAAAGVAVMVLVAAPLAAYIPKASLAGLLVLAAYRLVNLKHLRFHMRATRLDAGVLLATALSAVLISVEFCIVIGVFLSFALYVRRAAQVRLTQLRASEEGLREQREEGATTPALLAFELNGELFFGSEAELSKHFATISEAASRQVRVVILTLGRARNPDAAFLLLLKAFHERLHAAGVTLILCDVQADLRHALDGSGLTDALGPNHIFSGSAAEPSDVRAVQHARTLLDAPHMQEALA